MTKEEAAKVCRDYILNALRVEVVPDASQYPTVGVRVRILLDDDLIDEDCAALTHDHPDWREQR